MVNELPQAGFRAVILGIAQYATNAKTIIASNTRIAASTAALGSTANTASISQLTASFSGLGRTVKKLPADFSKAAFFLGRLQFVAISTIAALAALGAPIIFAAQFEKSLALISGLTNATREDVALLRKEILVLSRETAISPEELGASAYFILSSGIDDVNTALEVLELSAKASLAGLGAPQAIARTTTAILNAYELAAGDAAKVTDVLVGIVKEGAAEPEELAKSIGRVIPLAAQMGVEFSQVGAVLASMTNVGISTERSITGLIGIFSQLIRPTDRSRELFRALGFEITAFRQEVEQDFVGAMNRLFSSIEGNEEIIAELFPDIRGLIGALAAFGKQGEKTEAIQRKLAVAFGFLDSAVLEAEDTIAVKFRLALNSIRVALTQLGTTVRSQAASLFDGITRFVEKATVAARNFRDEFGETFVRTGRNIQIFIRDIGKLTQALAETPIGVSILAIFRALAAFLKILAKNADIVIPAMIAFGAVMLANTILSSGFVVGLRLLNLSLIQTATTLSAAAAQGTLLSTVLAGINVTSVFRIATAVGALVASTFIIKRFTSSTDDATESIKIFEEESLKLTAPFLRLGLTEEQAGAAVRAEDFIDILKELAINILETVKLQSELEALFAAQQIPQLRLPTLEIADIAEQIREAREQGEGFNTDLEAIKEQFVAIKGEARRAEFAAALERAKVPIEILNFLFDDLLKLMGGVEGRAIATFSQLARSLKTPIDRAEELADAVNDVVSAFGDLRNIVEGFLGIETREEAALKRQINELDLLEAETIAATTATGGLTDADELFLDQLDTLRTGFSAQLDVLRLNKQLIADVAVETQGLLPTFNDLIRLSPGVVASFDAQTLILEHLKNALSIAEEEGAAPLVRILKDLIAIAESQVVLKIDADQVTAADRKVADLLASWEALAQGAIPIVLPVDIQAEFEPEPVVESLFERIARLVEEAGNEVRRTRIAPTDARRENPFEEFISAEQARDLLLEIGRVGEATWRDVGRLWQLGFEDAADDLAAFMRGEIESLGKVLESAMREAGDEGMGALIRQILDGTVTALDALGLLEEGMLEAATAIIDALSGVADATEERMDIITEVIEEGVASIQQVGRLLELGFVDEATDLLRFLEGFDSEIFGSIVDFRRQFFRGVSLPTSFAQGGFVPAGPPVPAMLHGPEVVIPLGDMMGLRTLQRSLGGSGGGSEGFKNFGRMSIMFGSDADMAVTRSIRKALGA